MRGAQGIRSKTSTRRPHRTSPLSPHEITLVGVGTTSAETAERSASASADLSATLPPLPRPRVPADVLVVPLGAPPAADESPTACVRRRAERSRSPLAALATPTGGPFWATAETVTNRGMLITASTPLAENQWVVVEIHPHDRCRSLPPLRIKALVTFGAPAIGFGVRFIAMTERTRLELARITSAKPAARAA